ncbi:hypothetical protein ACWU4D_03905 [Vibrio sp. WJH972]
MTIQLSNPITEMQHKNQALHCVHVDQQGTNMDIDQQQRAKRVLDRLFPLNDRSHSEVCSYRIDMKHIVACFKDGQQTGLKYPGHFVAYIGERENPDSLLLRQRDGCYVEIMLGRQTGNGKLQDSYLVDVQMETLSYMMVHEENTPMTCRARYWVSLLRDDVDSKPCVSREDREFISKNCSEFTLYANDLNVD